MSSRVATVNDVLDGHVVLDLECLDRVYLNGYVPSLQVSGQVASFLTRHLGFPIASAAIFDQIGGRFRRAVAAFARDNDIAVVRVARGDRKVEMMRGYLDRAAGTGRSQVAAIGVAQEYACVFTGTSHSAEEAAVPWFSFAKADRRVTCYFFYLWDEDFGPAFVKVCCYFPYPMKIWVNGHEWAKRQAAKGGIGFTALAKTARTPGSLTTRVVTRGVDVTVNAYYKHSRIKQYLKEGRALRVETVVNDTGDLGVRRRLEHLDELQAKARDVNRRLVDNERVGQGCVLASPAFVRVARPSLVDGRRAPALRFGDPRVMALVGALVVGVNVVGVNVVAGFTNRSLRAQVAALLGTPYTMSQASYDLRRLRLKGLIVRLEHSNTYVLTPDGQRVAIFYSKVHDRLLRPLIAADRPPAPLPVRQALRTLDRAVTDYIDQARIAA